MKFGFTAEAWRLIERAAFFYLSPTGEVWDRGGNDFWSPVSCWTPACAWTIGAGFDDEPGLDVEDFRSLESALRADIRIGLLGNGDTRRLWYVSTSERVEITTSLAELDRDLDEYGLTTASALLRRSTIGKTVERKLASSALNRHSVS